MGTWCALGAVVARRRELGARPLHVDRRRVVQVPHVAALHVDVEVYVRGLRIELGEVDDDYSSGSPPTFSSLIDWVALARRRRRARVHSGVRCARPQHVV